MAVFPIEILFGIYLGLLAGILPALIAGGLAFLFKYVTGATLPGLGVVVLGVAIAGVNGGLMGLLDPSIIQSPRLVVALIVVMMLSLYSHRQGDMLGETIPRRFSFQSLRRQTLSADVIDIVEGRGQVTIKPLGTITDLEGYPPLSADLRAQISQDEWEFPADLAVSEIEDRLEERLVTEYNLADVIVSIGRRGRATISAAPPMGGLSRRVPSNQRAVSINALLPTGMARHDKVTIRTSDAVVDGEVLSAKSNSAKSLPVSGSMSTDGGRESVKSEALRAVAPTTQGGDGRITVGVPRSQAKTLLRADRGRVFVQSRGTGREFELVSLFRRAGMHIRKITVSSGSSLNGVSIAQVRIRDTYEITVLAVKRVPTSGREDDRTWVFSPRGGTVLDAGDELFVVGTSGALTRFEEAVV